MFVFREIRRALFSCYLRFERFCLITDEITSPHKVYFRQLSITIIVRNMVLFARINNVPHVLSI